MDEPKAALGRTYAQTSPNGTKAGPAVAGPDRSWMIYQIVIVFTVIVSIIPMLIPPSMQELESNYSDNMINAGGLLLLALSIYLLWVPGTSDFKKIAISVFMFIVLFLTGDFLYSYMRYVLNVEPTASVSDIFWVAGYFPLLYITYYTMWKNYEHIPIKKLMFTMIGWVLVLVCLVLPILILSFMTSEDLMNTLILSIYPILDTVLLLPLMVIIIIYREGYVLRSWVFTTIGIGIYVVGDMSYALFPATENYYLSTFPNVFFIAAYFIIALGVYTMIQMRDQFQSIEPSGRYSISQVFVAHKKGTLIAHVLTKEAKKCVDADVMVGMLTAIQDFVKESFEGDKHQRLDELKYGDMRLVFRRGTDFMLVAVISGQMTSSVDETLSACLADIQGKYGALISSWDGTIKDVAPIKDIVSGLLTNE